MGLGVFGRRFVALRLLTTQNGGYSCCNSFRAMLVPGKSSASRMTCSHRYFSRHHTGPWREGASLIITARSGGNGHNRKSATPEFDYKVLVLKQTHDKRGMYEFPGGAVTKADYAIQWAELFRSATKLDFGDIVQDFDSKNGHHPPILQRNENGIPAGLGTRIAAIRETFEATGILIVKGLDTLDVQDHIVKGVRDEIKFHPEKFMSLCKLLRVIPDVWALNTWSNWLTPPLPTVKEGLPEIEEDKYRRYDTVNYVCCLERIPEAICDKEDHQHAEWLTPSQLWDSDHLDLFLAPLQFDIARLANFPQLAFLHTFAQQRAKLGLEQLMLSFLLCKDGLLALLPGDDLYPKDVDLIKGEITHDHRTLGELWSVTQNHHRIEMASGDSHGSYRCNVQFRCGQPVPTRRLRRMLVFP